MGSASSKAARTAASSSSRKYPTRGTPSSTTQAAPSRPPAPPPSSSAHPPTSQQPPSGPTVHPPTLASTTRDEAVDRDASDPVYSTKLRTLGAVQPNPILSHSSTNPMDPTPRTAAASSSAPPGRDGHLEPFGGAPLPRAAFPAVAESPAVRVLEARRRAQEEAEREFAGRGAGGREFLDVGVIRQILTLRDKRGMSDEEVEKRLELKKGVVARLGPKGMVEGL